MKRLVSILLPLAASACIKGSSKQDAPSYLFRARDADRSETTLEPGDLVVVITNEIPEVSVPDPHTNTVFHLNAEACSETSKEGKSHHLDANGIPQQVSFEGEARCLDLAPTIFAHQSATFVVKKDALKSLINQDCELESIRNCRAR